MAETSTSSPYLSRAEKHAEPSPDQMDVEEESEGNLKEEQQQEALKEGSNIHFSLDGKKLCSHSKKVCKQRRMEGRAFCIKHILEDKTAGFMQCEYICKKKTGDSRCTNPVPPAEDGPYVFPSVNVSCALIPSLLPALCSLSLSLSHTHTDTHTQREREQRESRDVWGQSAEMCGLAISLGIVSCKRRKHIIVGHRLPWALGESSEPELTYFWFVNNFFA